MTIRLTKVEKAQLAVIVDELGHDRVRIEQWKRHKLVFFDGGGTCVIASSPSDCKGLKALRTTVRHQARKETRQC